MQVGSCLVSVESATQNMSMSVQVIVSSGMGLGSTSKCQKIYANLKVQLHHMCAKDKVGGREATCIFVMLRSFLVLREWSILVSFCQKITCYVVVVVGKTYQQKLQLHKPEVCPN